MISFAKKLPYNVFLFGNNSLHSRWLGCSQDGDVSDWMRVVAVNMAQVLICEGPWTQERAFILRELHSMLQAPKLLIFAGPISLFEQTILEGMLDHVDVFLPEGVEQFWRGDIQDVMKKCLSASSPSLSEGIL